LIPVDVTGANVKSGIKLMDFYTKLTEHPSKRVTVFLDACFSGAARGQELLAMRGVRIKSNTQNLSGNIVVFAASSGEQASLPYQAKQHGLFTYYFLKKLQESKGNLSYNEMYEYLQKQVGLNSVLVNNKEQNPQLLISPGVNPKLQEWKFN
jgi:murein tripeptide amidase MpaA